MSKRILVIAAHPDDEVFFAGGAIAQHVKKRDIVHVLILSEGVTSRDTKMDVEDLSGELKVLNLNAKKAHDILGTELLLLYNFPDNRMDSVDLLDVVKIIEDFSKDFKPEVVYTHNLHDLNVDHRIVNQAVVTAFRPVPKSSVKEILFFEVPSSTEWNIPVKFTPNIFFDVTKTIELKCEALKCYTTEMREYPHPRSIKGVKCLAQWRGMSVGVEYSEAFIVGRFLF